MSTEYRLKHHNEYTHANEHRNIINRSLADCLIEVEAASRLHGRCAVTCKLGHTFARRGREFGISSIHVGMRNTSAAAFCLEQSYLSLRFVKLALAVLKLSLE